MDRKPCNNGFYFMDSYLYKPVTMTIKDCFDMQITAFLTRIKKVLNDVSQK